MNGSRASLHCNSTTRRKIILPCGCWDFGGAVYGSESQPQTRPGQQSGGGTGKDETKSSTEECQTRETEANKLDADQMRAEAKVELAAKTEEPQRQQQLGYELEQTYRECRHSRLSLGQDRGMGLTRNICSGCGRGSKRMSRQ